MALQSPAFATAAPAGARTARSLILVELGKNRFTRQFLQEDTTGQAHAAMQQVYLSQAIDPICLCQPQGVAMHIQRRNGHYNLKRNPNTGHLHAPKCESFGGLPEDAAAAYDKDVLVQQKQNGMVSVRLSMPLTTLATDLPEELMSAASHSVRNDYGKRTSMTLRGYMNLLWETAALHEYDPVEDARRSYKAVRERLAQVTEDHQILAGHQVMADRLFIPDTPPALAYQATLAGKQAKQKARAEQIAAVAAMDVAAKKICHDRERPIVLVLGELLSAKWPQSAPGKPPAYECLISLKSSGMHHQIRDYAGVVAALAESNPGLVAQALMRPDVEPNSASAFKIWMLIGVQLHLTKTGTTFLKAVYAGCLLCSDKYIPVESSYELQVAAALQAQQRHFKKPLRYERDKDTRPDFVLLDTDQPRDMEVFGFTGDFYAARTKQKIDAAIGSAKPLWHWNPNKSQIIPPFPKPALTPPAEFASPHLFQRR